MGVQQERGHPGAADLLRVDHPVGAGSGELLDAGVLAGASHDEEIGSERSTGEGDEEVRGVGRQRRHQRARVLDAGLTQHVVARRVAQHVGEAVDGRDPLGIVVDDHDLPPGIPELLGDGSADPAPTAQDHVVAQPIDALVHPSPLHDRSEVALDDELQPDRQCVQRRAHAGQDQDDREHLARAVQRLDLPEAHRRDRRDRLVGGVQHAEAEQHVPDGAHHDDADQREDADHDVAHPPHRAQRTRRASSHGPVLSPRDPAPRPARLTLVTSWLPFGGGGRLRRAGRPDTARSAAAAVGTVRAGSSTSRRSTPSRGRRSAVTCGS